MMKRIFILCLTAVLLLGAAAAETTMTADSVQVHDVALDMLGSTLHYPQLTGIADEAVQKAANDAIMTAGQIEKRINRMAALLTSPVKLQVSYAHTLAGNVFSCAILADGAVDTTRATQVWSTVTLDLTTGESIPLDALFTDADAARAHIGEYLTGQVAPEQSAHLAAGNLTPLPESFSVSREGLTLYYPIEQFRTLSDRAGTVTLLWTEMREYLDLSEGSVLCSLGVPETLRLNDALARTHLTDALSAGGFPGVPAVIGQSVKELTDRYAQLTDNELCEAGRMFILEDGAFRGTWLITDALTDSWDKSTVSIIRTDRLNLHGLCTGTTTMAEWRQALGTPDATVTTGAAQADSWRILPGTSDYYLLGEYRLRLHADESGVLRSVFLMQ
ncbi:MAG: hypothetical protein E7327_03725 [Clostridiales bacterium]|nr:hypothetical protein [Clostridiales bacterium]